MCYWVADEVRTPVEMGCVWSPEARGSALQHWRFNYLRGCCHDWVFSRLDSMRVMSGDRDPG